jgi:ubiquinone/menaquinone biosynthesis C-methylase UbiE
MGIISYRRFFISSELQPAACVGYCMAPALPKPHKDRGMEGMVAKWYTNNTGQSLSEFTKLAKRIAKQLPRDSKVLEVAPGPGYFCIELAKLGTYSITGLDISHTFVEIASRKAAEAGIRADFRQGSASAMPFGSDAFDFLLCRAAFKNFGQPVAALQEMYRVLKPGGRGLIIDLRKDASMESINQEVEGMGLNPINKILTKLTFRTMLLKNAYTREQFRYMLAQANFRSVDIQESGIGFEISMTK